MIVKKLYRKVRCKWWNDKRKVYELTTVNDYMGWFLFGFIPIYLIKLDSYEDVDFEKTGEGTIRYGIYEKYGSIINSNNYKGETI